jgi:glycosyltransferase involved in cell wall biosynthesis
LKVSIITVCFNSQKTINDTIESVLSQSYQNIEYIIVDGNSTDNTLGIVTSYIDSRIRIISEPDNGIYDAINKGIALANGNLIGLLNSDDRYINTFVVQRIVDSFNKYSVEALFADVVYINRDTGKRNRYYSSKYFKPYMFRFGFMPAHPTFFTFKRNFELYGGYSNNYVIAADFDLMLRFLTIYKLPYMYINYPLVEMKDGGVSNANLINLITLNNEIKLSCISNGIYTNTIFIYLKYIFKWIGFLKRR